MAIITIIPIIGQEDWGGDNKLGERDKDTEVWVNQRGSTFRALLHMGGSDSTDPS